MSTKVTISYYCFNKACFGSVYNHKYAQVLRLPYELSTFRQKHTCLLCCSNLISLVDLDIRQVMGDGISLAA
ncbi:hypothetical protein ABIB62_001547 [Mucilaginibacter sp. UYP25]|uniref:hypothetical protein n=1 Tax=unclassified Mucilaginibacter TaxID=2617802 RepID=UPI00339433FA